MKRNVGQIATIGSMIAPEFAPALMGAAALASKVGGAAQAAGGALQANAGAGSLGLIGAVTKGIAAGADAAMG